MNSPSPVLLVSVGAAELKDDSHQPEDTNAIHVPFFRTLGAISYGEYKEYRYFDTGTLFWSLSRLFGNYERIMSVLDSPKNERGYLDSDIEHFVIRFRIVLNDIAFIIRRLLPQNVRGFKSPGGGAHPRNREMSYSDLSKSLLKSTEFPEVAAAFYNASKWVDKFKKERENVVHYKTKIVVFEAHPLAFGFMDAAGEIGVEKTSDGGHRLTLHPIANYVNDLTLNLHQFMHIDLNAAVENHATRLGLKQVQVGTNERIICAGIRRFRELNLI